MHRDTDTVNIYISGEGHSHTPIPAELDLIIHIQGSALPILPQYIPTMQFMHAAIVRGTFITNTTHASTN